MRRGVVETAAAAMRREIIRKHAVLGPRGNISRCGPSGGKVRFKTLGYAQRCATELAEWTPTVEMDAYQCKYGPRPHFHLTKRRVIRG